MQHPFQQLRQEYETNLARCQITRPDAVDATARRILAVMQRYATVSSNLAVPATLIAGLHMRESSSNFSTYLGNGEPLGRVTRLVPKGRGPFFGPGAWERGAEDALTLDHVNDNSAPWSVAYALWKAEAFNGFGPRAHGRQSGYVWAGTNIYTGGKYVADGVWDSGTFDQQLGVAPILIRIAQLAPQYAITGMPAVLSPSIVPAPLPAPEAVGGDVHTVAWVQSTLNRLGAHLVVDGSYGRRTREAVRTFQIVYGVRPVDGLVGPVTFNALDAALDADHIKGLRYEDI